MRETFRTVIQIVIAIGIWFIVLQNFNVFGDRQIVYVRGGNIDVNNRVNVNLDAINGKHNAFYDFGGDGDYIRIPVMNYNPK